MPGAETRLTNLNVCYDPEGGNADLLTWPMISPDGRKIAFAFAVGNMPCVEQYVADVGDEMLVGKKVLSGGNCASGNVISSYWSPNGKWLAYNGTNVPLYFTNPAAYVVNTDATNRRRLPVMTCDSIAYLYPAPCFSSAGREVVVDANGDVVLLAYESLKADNSLWQYAMPRMDPVTYATERLFTGKDKSDPASFPWIYEISPDNKWVSSDAGGWFYLIRTDGSGEYHNVAGITNGRWPFTCDGNRWYYVPNEKMNSLRAVNADGTGDTEVYVRPELTTIETPRCHVPVP